MARNCLCILCGLSLLGVVRAQPGMPEAVTTRSYSGQFVIRAERASRGAARFSNAGTNLNLVALEPALVSVSCERIKQMVWREIGSTGSWQGKILVTLYPAESAADDLAITSEQFRDGWQYRLDVPDVVQRTRYVRGMVQVVLLELANRSGGPHSAEIPTWLIEGLTRELLASKDQDVILQLPRAGAGRIPLSSVFRDTRLNSSLEKAHAVLSAHEPLSFEQLSWPTDDQWDGDHGQIYGASAQLFVHQLLRLPEGRACLCAMLAQLPQRHNWQLAFLDSFKVYFQRPLDVEKWWTLNLVHFTGRDLTRAWPVEESWRKLDEILLSDTQVRARSNDLPRSAQVTLQTIVRDWDRARQTPVLQAKLRELGFMQARVAQDVAPLVQGYYQTIEVFLQNQSPSGFPFLFRKKAAGRHAVEQALEQLDQLDARRAVLRAAQKRTPASETGTPSVPAS